MLNAAARGWLIAGALLWAGEVAAQSPERQRVPQPAPAVEGQAQREAQRGNRPAEPPPVPVRIIQSPDEAAHDAAREAKSDEHEANDLAAQRKAADAAADSAASAYGQVIAAVVGIFFSFAGTVLLVWTLCLTREANRNTRATYLADQRPWLSIEPIIIGSLQIMEDDNASINVGFKLHNHGKTPALRVLVHSELVNDTDFTIETAIEFCVTRFYLERQRKDRGRGRAVFPGTGTEEGIVGISHIREGSMVGSDANRQMEIRVAIMTEYFGSLEPTKRHTCKVFRLCWNDHGILRMRFPAKPDIFQKCQLRIEDMPNDFAT